MRRASFLLGPLLIVLAACSPQNAADEPERIAPPTTESATTEAPAAAPPPVAEPTLDGPCPYLDAAFVEETNGQRVGDIKISADEPTPACYFYRADGGVQLAVQIYTGDPAVAKAFVDQVAPVDTANPAELAGGWAGGARPTDEGAVYAVAKDGTAVVVATNQEQTLKGKLVAQEAISALGL